LAVYRKRSGHEHAVYTLRRPVLRGAAVPAGGARPVAPGSRPAPRRSRHRRRVHLPSIRPPASSRPCRGGVEVPAGGGEGWAALYARHRAERERRSGPSPRWAWAA